MEHLRPATWSMWHVVKGVVRSGCMKGLEVLDLSGLLLDDWDLIQLGWMLSEGCLKGLEELNLSALRGGRELDGVRSILTALAQGACPGLQRLHLSNDSNEGSIWSPDELEAMAGYLRSEHGQALQVLDMGSSIGDEDTGVIMTVLGEGCCPDLRSLRLPAKDFGGASGQALAMSLQSNIRRKMEELWLYSLADDDNWDGGHGDQGLADILQAIRGRCCPYLRAFGFGGLGVTSAAVGMALVQAISSDHCHGLQELELWSVIHDREANRALFQAIKQGALPNLRRLSLGDEDMDQEHEQVLAEAIQSGAMVKLEGLELDRSGDGSLGDEGVRAILEALEAGHNNMKELSPCANDMSSVASSALCRALAAEPFKHIQKISISSNPSLGDDAVADLIQALTPHRELRSLYLYRAGMGAKAGHALTAALREEAWPKLEELDIRGNKGLGKEAVWKGVAECLEGGGMQQAEKLRLDIDSVSSKSVERLCQALLNGACPRLRQLMLWTQASCREGLRRARPDISLGY